MLRLADGRAVLYQWDVNVAVEVDESIEVVDFGLQYADEILSVAVVDGVAMIPNILLQNGRNISAYAGCDSCTRQCAVFTVTRRPKPADYVYTETEILTYKSLEERVTALEKNGGSGIDTKPIYDEIATKITAPTTAEVGQTIVVSEVDENGKPTAWEMADMVSGGEDWELIADMVLEEETSRIEFTTNLNGNPIEATELFFYVLVSNNPVTTGYLRMGFYRSAEPTGAEIANGVGVTVGGMGASDTTFEAYGRVKITKDKFWVVDVTKRTNVYNGNAHCVPYGIHNRQCLFNVIKKIEFVNGMTYPTGTIIKFYKVR